MTSQPRQNGIAIAVILAVRSRLSKAVKGIKVGFALEIRQDLGTFGVRQLEKPGASAAKPVTKKGGREGWI